MGDLSHAPGGSMDELMSLDMACRPDQELSASTRAALHRLSRGAAIGCLLILTLTPLAMAGLRFLLPNAIGIRTMLFWAWLFLAPLVAGTGLLLAMLAIVVADRRHRGRALLLGVLTACFLILMSQVL